MKVFSCDHCGRGRPSNVPYDLVPTGWYTVTKRRPEIQPDFHFCRAACLLQYARAELALEQPSTILEVVPRA